MRALTRVHKPKNDYRDKPRYAQNNERTTVHIQPELNLVNPTGALASNLVMKEAAQELKYDLLPTTRKDLFKVLKHSKNNNAQEADALKHKVQCLRDYFNPVLNQNKQHAEDYDKFILVVLSTWLQTDESNIKQAFLPHLKEMASLDKSGQTFVEYLKQQMTQILKVLNSLSSDFGSATNDENEQSLAVKVLEKVFQMQLVYIKVMECPAGKLMDCLCQLCGHLYTKLSPLLSEAEVLPWFKKVLKHDIAIMQN